MGVFYSLPPTGEDDRTGSCEETGVATAWDSGTVETVPRALRPPQGQSQGVGGLSHGSHTPSLSWAHGRPLCHAVSTAPWHGGTGSAHERFWSLGAAPPMYPRVTAP